MLSSLVPVTEYSHRSPKISFCVLGFLSIRPHTQVTLVKKDFLLYILFIFPVKKHRIFELESATACKVILYSWWNNCAIILSFYLESILFLPWHFIQMKKLSHISVDLSRDEWDRGLEQWAYSQKREVITDGWVWNCVQVVKIRPME